MKIKWILILLNFVALNTFCQKNFKVDVDVFNTQNGLLSNNVFDVVEDKYGFLWIATNSGVVRYDGKNFKTFGKKKPQKNEISRNSSKKLIVIDDDLFVMGFGLRKINLKTHQTTNYLFGFDGDKPIHLSETFVVYKDSKKRIWLTTSDAGLFMWQNNRFEKIHPPNYLNIKEYQWISSFFERQNGDLVFCTLKGIVVLTRNDSALFYKYDKFYKDFKSCRSIIIEIKPTGQFIVFQDDIGCSLFNLKTGKFLPLKIEYKNISYDEIYKLIKNNNYYCSQYGVFIYDNLTNEIIMANIDNVATSSILKSRDNSIWICSSNGLKHLIMDNPAEFQITNFIFNESNVFFDSISNKFFLIKFYNPNQIYYFSVSDTVLRKFGNSFDDKLIHATKSIIKVGDTFYISSFNGLWKYSRNMKRPLAVSSPIEISNCYTTSRKLLINKNKLLISGVPNGPYLYDFKTKQYKLLKQYSVDKSNLSNKSFEIVASCFDHSGNIYTVNTYSDTIIKWNNNGEFIRYYFIPKSFFKHTQSILNYDIIVDRFDNIWVFCQNVGLLKFDVIQKKWYNLFNETSYNQIIIENLFYDENEKIYSISAEDVYTINVKSHVISKIDNKYKDKNSSTSLLSIEPINKKKLMVMDGTSHIAIYNTTNNFKYQKPILYCENLKLMGVSKQEYLIENKIILPANQNTFSLDIGVPFLSSKDEIIYQVKLDGIENEWRSLGNVHTINYAGVPPGEYKLQIKAKSSSDLFPEVQKTIIIIAQAAWYQTNWFKISSFLILGFVIFFIIRLYFKNQLQKQKAELDKQLALSTERNRIATDMHDDLGAGLSQIMYLTREAIDKTNDGSLKLILKKTRTKSDNLIDKMNDIIWSLNTSNIYLEDLLVYMKSSFSEFIEILPKKFSFNMPENIPAIELKNEVKRNVYLVCKEAIHNSLKHSKASEISMSILIQSKNLNIEIVDNGIGFDVNKNSLKGNGLNNYFKRMNSIGGTVSLDSNKNGTTIKFIIPLDV